MTASLRRTVTVTVAALGVAFLLVWAATTGPQGVVGERHEATPSSQPGAGNPSESTDHAEPDDRRPESSNPREVGTFAGWAQDLAAFLVVVAGLVVIGRILRRVFLHIHRGLEELVLPLEPLPDLDTGRAAVERDQERQREALAGSDVRNGIVECWVVFEEAAAAADVARRPSETATEFVVRFLHLLDVDPRSVGELERLFHEARFSTHPMGSETRRRAQAALAAIHRDLELTGVST